MTVVLAETPTLERVQLVLDLVLRARDSVVRGDSDEVVAVLRDVVELAQNILHDDFGEGELVEPVAVTAGELLGLARDAVARTEYGPPRAGMGDVAALWTALLGQRVEPHEVALCLGLLKIARLKASPGHLDSYVDLAGYAGVGAECAIGAKR